MAITCQKPRRKPTAKTTAALSFVRRTGKGAGMMCGFLLAGLVAFFYWDTITARLAKNSPLFSAYLWMAIPLAFFYVINVVLSLYSGNFRRIVVPSILVDFSQKLVFLPSFPHPSSGTNSS